MKQIVKAFSGGLSESTDISLAAQIENYATNNNLYIQTISYSVGRRGYAMVVFVKNE